MSLKDEINGYLSVSPLEASEYTFTNIISFKDKYHFQVSLLEDTLIILTGSEPVSAYCPVGESESMNTIIGRVFDYLEAQGEAAVMERVPESFVNKYLKNSGEYTVIEDRDSFDYVYNVKELVELRGRKFHDKKNKVNKFRNEHAYQYHSLTPELIPECIEFEDYWCDLKDCEKFDGLLKERSAIITMLGNFKDLNIKGGVIKIDNRIQALTIGEKYLHDTLVVHVEKAVPHVPGLYQVINQEFLSHEAADCLFVNREQDLGLEGLRRAKVSYQPVTFIKKYKVTRRSGENR